MTLHVYRDLIQGSDEWLSARCGTLTASVIGRLITVSTLGALHYACPDCHVAEGDPCVSKAKRAGSAPTPIKTIHPARTEVANAEGIEVLGVARTDTAWNLTLGLIAERITGHVEALPMTSSMWRGVEEEPLAREAYAQHRAPVDEVGFMVLEGSDGHRLGYSPDGLVGEDGLIEIKSRSNKVQVSTVIDDTIPAENMAQLQCGLLVSGRAWCDYVSYSAGMPLWVKRVEPDARWFEAIFAALDSYETDAAAVITSYEAATTGLPLMERNSLELVI